MKSTVLKHLYESEIYAARNLIVAGDLDGAFKRLEIAHVLGQRHVLRHVETHWLMLKIGVKRNSAREIVGQVLRIVIGAIGSCIGVVPIGNTGGTNISMFRRLPIPFELKRLLK
jgi:hypothetical protein